MDALPFNPPDPRELATVAGEVFRRRVRAQALLEAAEYVDSERRAEIAREIMVLGAEALPALFRATNSHQENKAVLARSLVRLLVPDEVGRQLYQSLQRKKQSYAIEFGAALLSRLPYPNLSVERVIRNIDALGIKAGDCICKQLSVPHENIKKVAAERTLDVIKNLSEFWRDEGFCGNNDNFYSDRNIYLSDVLERRTGLPITLSVLYLALARRVFLNADGVGMPGHFIVRIRVRTREGDQFVLVDPFNGARPLNVEDCRQRVESTGQPFVFEEHLKATPARDILTRMCNNLLALFDQQKKTLDAERVATVLVHLQPRDPVPLLIRAERRLRRGERRGARHDFQNAKILDPAGPIGHMAEELLRRMEYENSFE
ncbi:MAG: transglutaminase-like domain-containing protein [Planctomycetota bacterium]